MKIVATNKKAFHDYFVIDSFEAGINLVGCEVKSVRAGEVNLKDSYAVIRGGQLVLVSAYIKNYDTALLQAVHAVSAHHSDS